MKALIKKSLFTFFLLLVSAATFAQTTVFGHWASENGHEIYIHSTSNLNHFAYSQDTDCYGGIAVVNEMNEYSEYYIFNKIAGENGKLSIKYTKVKALDGEKIEKGKLDAVLDNGNVIINGNDELSNIVFENREVYNEDINDGAFTAEEFFAIAQKQADAKGLDVHVDSFDSYFAAYHEVDKQYKRDAYGEYTISFKAVSNEKMEAQEAADFVAKIIATKDDKYVNQDVVASIKEVYTITVRVSVDGEKKDLEENYLVHMAYCNDKWQVVSHSA